MNDNTLQVKHLFYENMGSEPFYLRNFFDTIEYLDEPFSEITLQVVRLLTGDMHACNTFCHEDSRIEAQVQIGTNEYSVIVTFEDGIAVFYVTDERSIDRTLWYLQTVAHTPEEQKLSCFSKPGVYPVRLHQYKDPEQRYPGDFREATRSIGSTQSFRGYLRRFIRGFEPACLLPGKNCWLHLETDGRFTVRLGVNGEEIPCLSETEKWVYHFLCYLHLLRFWDGMQDLRNYKDIKLPILIRDFADRLDESIDAEALYAQADGLNRQRLIIKQKGP